VPSRRSLSFQTRTNPIPKRFFDFEEEGTSLDDLKHAIVEEVAHYHRRVSLSQKGIEPPSSSYLLTPPIGEHKDMVQSPERKEKKREYEQKSMKEEDDEEDDDDNAKGKETQSTSRVIPSIPVETVLSPSKEDGIIQTRRSSQTPFRPGQGKKEEDEEDDTQLYRRAITARDRTNTSGTFHEPSKKEEEYGSYGGKKEQDVPMDEEKETYREIQRRGFEANRDRDALTAPEVMLEDKVPLDLQRDSLEKMQRRRRSTRLLKKAKRTVRFDPRAPSGTLPSLPSTNNQHGNKLPPLSRANSSISANSEWVGDLRRMQQECDEEEDPQVSQSKRSFLIRKAHSFQEAPFYQQEDKQRNTKPLFNRK
jgi:hypothetical protein